MIDRRVALERLKPIDVILVALELYKMSDFHPTNKRVEQYIQAAIELLIAAAAEING